MPENTVLPNLPPPSGNSDQAQKYLEKLINLLGQEKILVTHTDISKLDPSSLQDHYYITLNDYHIEISHTKKADTGEDFYILLFNNLKQIKEGCSEKVILAFMNLTVQQFEEFKKAAKVQLDNIQAREDARRFAEIMTPIDQALENLNNYTVSENSVPESPVIETPVAEIPEPINFAEAPALEIPEPPIINESAPASPIPNSVPENLVPENSVSADYVPDSLPEIPIFNEPVPQTPTI